MSNTPLRNILLYGSGGIGKSTTLATAVAYVWKTFKRKSRIVNADGGGTASALQAFVEEGIAEIWNVDQWDEKSIFLSLDLATKGWWPKDAGTPNAELLAPAKEWKECPSCHGDTGAKGLTAVTKCGACGKDVPPGVSLKFHREPINGLESVGLVGFEGFTSFGDLLMRRLRKVDPSGGRSISDGDFKISAPGQQHYGDAQSYLQSFVANVRLIPVDLVMWTALEIKADDEGKPLFGPKGPGKALTSTCIPWFTDVLHLDAYPKMNGNTPVRNADGTEALERKLFLAPHYPPDNKIFKFAAKSSAPTFGGGMPLSIEPDMRKFFPLLEEAFKKAKEELLK
jgi:hypothetical protein